VPAGRPEATKPRRPDQVQANNLINLSYVALRLSLAVVRDLRVARAPATPDDLAALETDVLAGFVLARAAAGLADSTIGSDVVHLEQVRAWFGRALWELEPPDADVYFGKVLRETAKGTRLSRAQALKTFFLFRTSWRPRPGPAVRVVESRRLKYGKCAPARSMNNPHGGPVSVEVPVR
jgi:hypothetical protein